MDDKMMKNWFPDLTDIIFKYPCSIWMWSHSFFQHINQSWRLYGAWDGFPLIEIRYAGVQYF
jgi:hypothetical protein